MQPSIKKLDLASEYYFDEGCYITEISNSKDDPGLSIVRARVEPGVTTKLHSLSNTIERYIIIEGKGIVFLDNQKPTKVCVNDVVIIPADCSQQITNNGNSDLIFLAVCSPRFSINCYTDLSVPV